MDIVLMHTFVKTILMKQLLLLSYSLLLLVITSTAQQATNNPNAKKDTTKKSIKAIAIGKIGKAAVTINYYSPAVRNRVIWGGLVPYDEVWVTGAHSATNIEIDKGFTIGNTTIKAGKYAIFTIPGKDEWTFIVNKNYQQHLADDYNIKEDIVRHKVKAISTEQPLERLQYFIENDKIIVAWDKIKIEIPVTVK
jgi:hypothetical protein